MRRLKELFALYKRAIQAETTDEIADVLAVKLPALLGIGRSELWLRAEETLYQLYGGEDCRHRDALLNTSHAAAPAPRDEWYIIAPLADEGILRLGRPSRPIFRKARVMAIVQDLCGVAGLHLRLAHAADLQASIRMETSLAAQRHIRKLQLSWGNIVHNCASGLDIATYLIHLGNLEEGLAIIASEHDKLRAAAHASPEEISQGNLYTFLSGLVDDIKKQGVDISLQAERPVIDQAPLFSEDINRAMLDVARGLVHNALRHARPPIQVRLAYSIDRLVLWVVDSGSHPAPLGHDYQSGTTFILSHVEQMGGTLIAQSQEEGTRIAVTIPWTVALWGKQIRDSPQ
jgi:hypothetical protein